MSKRINIKELPDFGAVSYLTDVMDANWLQRLAISRARGMTEIAKTAGITREALYKALRPDSAPRDRKSVV